MNNTCGDALISLLSLNGVDTVFGIPGVHNAELFRSLSHSQLKYFSARHEQSVGFMASGYAKVSGKPGVCFVTTGPGVTNILTAMAQALSDSLPLLIIASVNAVSDLGIRRGRLHELSSQRAMVSYTCIYSHTLLDIDSLPEIISHAFMLFNNARPGPIFIEVPVNLIGSESNFNPQQFQAIADIRPGPDPELTVRAAELLAGACNPVLFLGGGAQDASKESLVLAEKLSCPVINTIAGKGIVPGSHPLCVDATMAYGPVRELLAQADVVLAVGTEFSETDLYADESPLTITGKLIRIDIDVNQFSHNQLSCLAILSDARLALSAINRQFEIKGYTGQTTSYPCYSTSGPGEKLSAIDKVEEIKQRLQPLKKHESFFGLLRDLVPEDAIVVGDSTQPIYDAGAFMPMYQPRSWLSSVTGYGTLGYGLPAAIGAKLAQPERVVVAVVGDGGMMFTLPELAVAVELQLSLPIVVWNDGGYGEIRNYMNAHEIPLIGVDLYTPSFAAVGKSFGCRSGQVQSLSELKQLIEESLTNNGPTIIEVVVKKTVTITRMSSSN